MKLKLFLIVALTFFLPAELFRVVSNAQPVQIERVHLGSGEPGQIGNEIAFPYSKTPPETKTTTITHRAICPASPRPR